VSVAGTLVNPCGFQLYGAEDPETDQAAIAASQNEVVRANPFTGAETEMDPIDDDPVTVDGDSWPASQDEYAFAVFSYENEEEETVDVAYVLFHPNHSGQHIHGHYLLEYAIALPASLPASVTGLPCTDNTYLLKCDVLQVTDENGDLSTAHAASSFPVGSPGSPDVRFTVASDGVIAPEGAVAVRRYLDATHTDIAAGNLYVRRALGEIYVKKSYVDTWKDDGGRHCLRVNAQLVGGP